jgi:membrane protease YdiL (CAAX protease family)
VIFDYEFRPGALTPLLLGIFVFAAGEEIGWRGFALPALLARGYRPLTATVLLGVPWALLHLPLAGAGMLNEGWSMWALFVFMMAISVLVSWVYLASGLSITSAVLFHGGQNVLAVLNDGIDPLKGGWVMVGVYGLAATLVVIATKGRLGMPPEEHRVPNPGASPISLTEREQA